MRLAALSLLLLLPLAANAAEVTCKRSTALNGQCRTVKGSLGLTTEAGVVLTQEDGTRVLIRAPADSNMDIAPVVMQNWLYWQSKTNSMKTRILGSFELCPLPAQTNAAGIAAYACINSASHIAVDKASQN